ncbi:DNA polymerase III subunit delta [Perlucidibaca aquatica]|uniref:DNA polymerase III subunit delta n=1 Tax=Perlucidibaca aquatica TaxID=1852776 RepID=UPI00083B3927|nr:DNA polymerase III subunit delta [Perlucidibaca aquatica]
MKLRPEQLQRHLLDGLQSVYVLCGDEPLLLQESTDLIRQAATKNGYSERQVHAIERGFSWDALIADSQALSLFAERKLVELRFSGKPDAAAADVLIDFAQRPPEDTLLLITLPKLDAAAQKSKWFTALDNHGVQITVYPVDASALPGWLSQRAQSLGLRLPTEALQLLADRTEGNLLAAAQALEKLRLLSDGNDISFDTVASLVSDSTRYSVFDLADAVLMGDASRAARLLLGLESEGQAESVVLWALQKDLRALTLAAEQMSQSGQQALSSQALNQLGFWAKRQGPAQQALRRLSLIRLQRLTSGVIDVDKAIKGQSPERAWDALLRLTMAMAGRPLFV